jgi:hypothetical protein
MNLGIVIRTGLLAACLAAAVACSDSASGGGTPTAPSPTPAAPALNLGGAWAGTLQVEGESECCRVNSWTASQSGASVSGPLVLDVGEGQTVTATLTGTVSGSQLAPATFTVAAGAIGDPNLRTCAFTGTGTLAATAASLSGTLAMTFPPACVGEELVSRTPTGTWRITLAK